MKIKILGEELDIKFCMAVEVAYEEMTGTPFTIDAMSSTRNSVALCMAAIFNANADTQITVDRLLHEATGQEIATLNTTVAKALTEWLRIPQVITDAEKKEPQPDVNDEEEQKKN